MLGFKEYLFEMYANAGSESSLLEAKSASESEKLFQNYLFSVLNVKNKKDNRKSLHHVKFPISGKLSDFNKVFKKFDIEVTDSDWNESNKFRTYILKPLKPIKYKGKVLGVDSKLYWINSDIKSSGGKEKIKNKELTPDALNLAGREMTSDEIIRHVTNEVNSKYKDDESLRNYLISLLENAKSKKSAVELPEAPLVNKDLTKLSADFGEILAAIWSQSNLRFTKSYFPAASNEKLVDFYGERLGIRYPISVKSGEGGKAAALNIIDNITDRGKINQQEIEKKFPEIVQIFRAIKEYSAKEQLLVIHQILNTEMVNDLAKIMGTNSPKDISMDSLGVWLDKHEVSDLVDMLGGWWNKYSKPSAKIIERGVKIELILRPLGESLKRSLNDDKKLSDQINELARMVSVIQVYVDVLNKKMTFKHKKFKEAKFSWAWPGYSAGNKIGFKMQL